MKPRAARTPSPTARSPSSPRQTWRVAGSSRRSPTSSTTGRSTGAAPRERPQPREQLGERERLGQVVVGAAVEPGDAVLDRVARGQHQDRRPDAVVAQPAAGLEAVDARQHHVEHDRVVLGRAGHPQRVLAAARRRPPPCPPRAGRGGSAPPSSPRPRRRESSWAKVPPLHESSMRGLRRERRPCVGRGRTPRERTSTRDFAYDPRFRDVGLKEEMTRSRILTVLLAALLAAALVAAGCGGDDDDSERHGADDGLGELHARPAGDARATASSRSPPTAPRSRPTSRTTTRPTARASRAPSPTRSPTSSATTSRRRVGRGAVQLLLRAGAEGLRLRRQPDLDHAEARGAGRLLVALLRGRAGGRRAQGLRRRRARPRSPTSRTPRSASRSAPRASTRSRTSIAAERGAAGLRQLQRRRHGAQAGPGRRGRRRRPDGVLPDRRAGAGGRRSSASSRRPAATSGAPCSRRTRR